MRTKRWYNLQRGQGSVEYGVLVFSIAIGLVLLVGFFRETVRDSFFQVLCELRDLGRNSTSCEIVDNTIRTFEGEDDLGRPTALFVWNGRDDAALSPYDPSADADQFTYSFYGDRNPDDGNSILSDDAEDGTDALTYQWNFGDGEVDFTNSPRVTHTFDDEEASYFVTLTVIDAEGNRDTYGDIFTVTVDNLLPRANFQHFCDSGASTCVFQADAPASDPSTDPDGDDDNLVYQWNFGDGSPTLITSKTQVDNTYTISGGNGTFRVQLTVTDELGGTSVIYKTIFVGTSTTNRAPEATFSVSGCGSGDYECTIDASGSSDDGLINTYEFDPGTGTFDIVQTSSIFNVTFGPGVGAAGTYTARLRVTDNGSPNLTSDPFVRTIELGPGNAEPTITLESPNPTCTITRVCTVEASGDDFDASPAPLTIQWDFDYSPGNFTVDATGSSIDHQYDADGTYTIAVRTFDGQDYSPIETVSVTVERNDAPIIDVLKIDDSVALPGDECSNDPSCTLTSTIIDEDVSSVDFMWDVDNDGTVDVTNTGVQSLTYNFSGLGTGSFTVRLTVEDDIGQTDSAVVLVVIGGGGGGGPVGPDSAAASFLVLTSSGWSGTSGVNCKLDGTTCSFRNTSTTAAAFLTSCAWDMNEDGAADVTNNCTDFVHDFGSPGTYDVTLTATDSAGDTDTITKTVTVLSGTTPSVVTASYRVQDSSTTFSDTSPVTCHYIGENACTFDSTASSDIGTIISCAWDMDNDGTTDVPNNCNQFTYSGFAGAGQYTVVLTATDDQGSTDTVSKQVTVQAPPASLVTANFETKDSASTFSLSDPTTCVVNGTTCTFRDSSSTTAASIDVCIYDFENDGSVEVNDNCGEVSHDFGTAGTYDVKFTAIDNEGTSATITKEVIVPSTVVAQYEVNTTSGYDAADGVTCNASGTQCQVRSTSTTTASTIDTCAWDINANGTNDIPSNCSDPVTIDFGGTGDFPLRLTVTDNTGNTASVTKTITIPDVPPEIIANFAVVELSSGNYVETDGATCEVGNGNNDTQCTFEARASENGGTVESCSFDFDNDGTFDDVETNTSKCLEPNNTKYTFKYPNSGTYTVVFKVDGTASDGTTPISNTITRTVVVP